QRVDVAGFGIDGRRRPSHPVGRHVALEDVELVLPDELAAIGVERHHPFLKRGATPGRVLYVDAIASYDRRRPAAVRDAPEKVLAVQLPAVDETRLGRPPVALRTARFGPVANRNAPRPL